MRSLDESISADGRSQAHRPMAACERRRGDWQLAGERLARMASADPARPLGRRRRASTWRCSSRAGSGIGVLSLDCPDGRFPSIGRLHPPAIRLERAIRDLFGIERRRVHADHAPVARPSRWTRRSRCYASCRSRARACIRFRSVPSMPASSSPAISASPPTARPSCGSRSGWAMSTRASKS